MFNEIKGIFSKDFCASCYSLQKENAELKRREKKLLRHIEDIKNHDSLHYCCCCNKHQVEGPGEWCENCRRNYSMGI